MGSLKRFAFTFLGLVLGSLAFGPAGAALGAALGAGVDAFRIRRHRGRGAETNESAGPLDIGSLGAAFLVFILVVTPYNAVVVFGAAAHNATALQWIEATRPLTDAMGIFVPAIYGLVEGEAAVALYRLRAVRHIYAVSWLFGLAYMAWIAFHFSKARRDMAAILGRFRNTPPIKFAVVFSVLYGLLLLLFLIGLFISFIGPQLADFHAFSGSNGLREALGIGPAVAATVFFGALLVVIPAAGSSKGR